MQILPRELTQFQRNLNGEGRKTFFGALCVGVQCCGDMGYEGIENN